MLTTKSFFKNPHFSNNLSYKIAGNFLHKNYVVWAQWTSSFKINEGYHPIVWNVQKLRSTPTPKAISWLHLTIKVTDTARVGVNTGSS